MVHCGCAAATVLVACLSGATAMPDNDGRPYWKELMSAESPAPALHTLPDRQLNKQRSLATGAERARARGKYKANALVLPQHWIRGDDPGHPGMKMNVDLERAHTANIMPENSLWKDHDSDVCSRPPPPFPLRPRRDAWGVLCTRRLQLVMQHSMLILIGVALALTKTFFSRRSTEACKLPVALPRHPPAFDIRDC